MTTVATALRTARYLIWEPELWTQGQAAQYRFGDRTVRPDQQYAYCLTRALWEADTEVFERAVRVLWLAVPTHSLEYWNDDPKRTHAEVLAALDRAIALADGPANNTADVSGVQA